MSRAEYEAARDALRSRTGKAPGPDKVVYEMLVGLTNGSLVDDLLYDLVTLCWRYKKIPTKTKVARLVMVYKNKGATTNIASYRPIALIRVVLKLYTGVLFQRVRGGLDGGLHELQFGHRPDRSTTDALAIARRPLHLLLASDGGTSAVLLLNWKSAFDELGHSRIEDAMRRIGIPGPMREAISSVLKHGEYVIDEGGTCSTPQHRPTGIFQGDPLSVYLYIISTTVLIMDTHTLLKEDLGEAGYDEYMSSVYNIPQILYADDTSFTGTRQEHLQRMLSPIGKMGQVYNQALNQTKTHLVRLRGHVELFFGDGTEVPIAPGGGSVIGGPNFTRRENRP